MNFIDVVNIFELFLCTTTVVLELHCFISNYKKIFSDIEWTTSLKMHFLIVKNEIDIYATFEKNKVDSVLAN